MPDAGEALRLFVEYTKTQGVSDADIAKVVTA
jgi:hypothetical protein